MNKVNYQSELDKMIETITKEGRVPTLLMHSCCAPCSSYCISYLAEYFRITIFYYNPNISPEDEYRKRVQEQIRLIQELPVKYPVSFAEGEYSPDLFMRWQREWKKYQKGENGVFPAMKCGRERRHIMRRNMVLTFLQQHYRSVRIRTHRN